jgi:preprotein translocase subunit SecG
MDSDMILNISQLVLAILLTAAILMQARGSGAGIAFGGDGNVYRTRRGVEKKLHAATVALAVLFLGVALANVLFSF